MCFLVFQALKTLHRDSRGCRLSFGTSFISSGGKMSENMKREKFPVFRQRRRSPELEVGDEEYSVSFDGIF